MKKKISIIVITFNNFKELQSTLNSIPVCAEFEIIVVNGGECFQTKELLQSRSDIIHITEPDYGISDAFNKGFKLSSGEYFIYINSGDILLDPNYIYSSLEMLDANNTLGFSYSDILLRHPTLGKIYVTPKAFTHPGMPFCHQTLITRSSIIKGDLPFDLNLKYAMDFDFFCKYLKLNHRGAYFRIPAILMDGSGISSSNPSLVYYENLLILKRHKQLDAFSLAKVYLILLKLKFKKTLNFIGLNFLVIILLKLKFKK